MPTPLRTARVESPIGPLCLAASERGLAAIELQGDEAAAHARWRALYGRPVEPDPEALGGYAEELERYFAGAITRFQVPTDILIGTEFQRRVWQALAGIPYGETRSYKWLAQQVGQPRGYRAVGLANGANPLPIVVPCHRVVNTGGQLGGYGGGLAMKRALLRLEGALAR